MALVVVLPCVPATATTFRFFRMFAYSHSGPEVYGRRFSNIASTSSFPRESALPTTTRSGRGDR